MPRAHCLSLLVTMIVVLLLLMSLEVHAQSTVDDDDSCQSTTLEEVVNIIRAGIKSTRTTLQATAKEDLAEIKNLLGSLQESVSINETSRDVKLVKEDLTEVKNLLGSLQKPSQCSAVDSSSLCEYKNHSPLISMQCVGRVCDFGLQQ